MLKLTNWLNLNLRRICFSGQTVHKIGDKFAGDFKNGGYNFDYKPPKTPVNNTAKPVHTFADIIIGDFKYIRRNFGFKPPEINACQNFNYVLGTGMGLVTAVKMQGIGVVK